AKLTLRILITTTLLVWAFSQIDMGQFWEAVRMAKWQWLIAVWALTAILFWIRSAKMRFILKRQDCRVGIGTIFGASTMTALYSLILPGILSTGVKWYVLRKSTGKGSNVFSSMVYNLLSTMIVMTVFGLAALIISNPTSLLIPDTKNQWLLPAVCGVLLIAVLVVTGLLLSSRTGRRLVKILKLPLSPLPERIRQKGEDILDQIAVFQAVGWRFHVVVASMTIGDTLVGGVLTYVLAAQTAGIITPVSVFVWLCAFLYILGRMPISIANLGVREVTLVGFLALYGAGKPAAMLMSMVLFSALVFMAIIGAVYQLTWTVTARKSNQEPIEPAP
ncbi:MAG: lysylphosphatidylglycerol synthase transmembrane domain-containing protein, partial [Planctomycetota bacterium]